MSVIDISCLEVWREISNYIDGEIDAELRVRMEAHFRTCAHCKAVLQGTQNVVKLIGDRVNFAVVDLDRNRTPAQQRLVKDYYQG
jgi:anti-sigma factor RsiW